MLAEWKYGYKIVEENKEGWISLNYITHYIIKKFLGIMMKLPKASKYLVTIVYIAYFIINLVINFRATRRQTGSNTSTCQLLDGCKSKCNCNGIAF